MSTATQTVVVRRRIFVCGIVQGVGFRPFIYQLAQHSGVSGYVLNSSSGVIIEIEGPEPELDTFVHLLRHNAPPLAQVESLHVNDIEPLGDNLFVIRESAREAGAFVLVAPDVATCNDCWREVLDPSNRRYGYNIVG